MSTKTIPLNAVRTALMCAVIKQKTAGREVGGKAHCRTAAFTYYSPFASACREARRGSVNRHLPAMHNGVMSQGDLGRVVERVRLERGLQEVRRTWGVGLRALLAELGNGVMR